MRRPTVLLVLFAGFASFAFAQPADIPLTNWTVPPYHGSSGGLTTMTDATPPRVFIGVQPCRLVDTRTGSGFPAGFGPPSLSPGVQRSFDLDNGPCPGLPSGIDAYSLNVTVTNTAGPGHLVIYPQGGAQPTVSSINYVAGQTIANAVIVPAGAGGGVTVVAAAGTNLLIDINGYFSDTLGNPANRLELVNNNSSGRVAAFVNQSTTCNNRHCGISVETASGGAIFGLAAETGSGGNIGVLGATNDDGAGVYGSASTQFGFGGQFDNSLGVGARGHGGLANNSAGVQGYNGAFPVAGSFTTTGVRGETSDAGYGVMGLTTGADAGVAGFYIDGQTTNALAGGYLGLGPGSSPVGVFFFNGLAGTGTKSFIEPHPTDASKVIKFVSLEGNEAGTYFRGRGKFQNGLARIRVPEDFRIVTDTEGLTVQITPIGGMASVGVLRIGLDEIVAQSSRDLEFSYTVNGVRRAYPHVETIVENERYLVPQSADARIPDYLSPDERQRLIDNGTYRPDGTVNLETARRLRWDKIWEPRSRPAPQAAGP